MKVSVVIPVYNVEQYIGRCLESVLTQTYENIEVVVVNDATPDRSMEVVRQYQAKDKRIKVLEHTANTGLMTSRRDGFEMATGDYIFALDSDDCLAPQAIEKLVAKAREGFPDIVAGQLLKKMVNGNTLLIASNPLDSCHKEEIYKALLEEKLKHSVAGKLFRASLLREKSIQTFEHVTLSEDCCLFYQLVALCNRIVTLDEVVYYYMENKASSTNVAYSEKQVESVIIANRVMASCVAPYPSLKRLADHKFTFNIFRLYMEKISMRNLEGLIAKHHMTTYAFRPGNLQKLTMGDYWFLLKRFVLVRILWLKSKR